MAFRRVAGIEDLEPGRGRCFEVDGVSIGLFRVGDELFAIENACPHAGHPLSEGELAGTVVTCPAHGFEYDLRTGFRPDDADGFPIPRFEVRIEEGEVWVDLERVVNRPRRT